MIQIIKFYLSKNISSLLSIWQRCCWRCHLFHALLNCLWHWIQGYLTFSWTDSIWVFKCPCCFLLYSQRLQVYWTFSWTDSLWVFKIPCVVALYSHRLHGYTQLLPVLIQYEASDVPVSQSCQKKSRSMSSPCEERWDGPSDLTWEPVSIFIHDKKQQSTPALSILLFNIIFQPIYRHFW